MARQIGFHVYSVGVKEKYQREYQLLASIHQEHDLLLVAHSGMRAIKDSQKADNTNERLVSLKRVELQGRHLIGLMEAGQYGEAAEIIHASTGQLVHHQKDDEATMLPCFFRLVVPIDKQQGLLILQRDNRVHSKGAFVSLLRPILEALEEQLTLEIEPIANRETFEKLVNDGQVQRLTFIKNSITQDFADEYEADKDRTEGTMAVIVSARRGRGLPMKQRLTQWMKSDGHVRDMFELPGLDFEFDTVKADLRIGRNKRTIDFGKRISNPIIDMTDKIQWRAGRPSWMSLVAATAELAEDAMFDAYGE